MWIYSDFRNKLFISHGKYIQSSDYIDSDAGIHWIVVVVRPGQTKDDFLHYTSSSFSAIAAVAVLVSLSTLFLMCWVVRYRNMQLWKAAQPSSLLLILFTNAVCVACAFVLAGPPTHTSCMLRQWWVCLSITMTCAALVVKVLRVYLLFTSTQHFVVARLSKGSTKGGSAPLVQSKHVFAAVGVIVLVQVVIVAVWSAVDPMVPVTLFDEGASVVYHRTTCKSQSQWGFVAVALVLFVLLVTGCVVSYKSRNLSELFAESRALMATFYHGTLITICITTAAFVGSVSAAQLDMYISIGMCWFTASTQAMLFLPRMLRHISKGDLTFDEVKDIARRNIQMHVHQSRRSQGIDEVRGTGTSPGHKTDTSRSGYASPQFVVA